MTKKEKTIFELLVSALVTFWKELRKNPKRRSSIDNALILLIPIVLLSISMFIIMVMGVVTIVSVVR
jgi:hypothetical protein